VRDVDAADSEMREGHLCGARDDCEVAGAYARIAAIEVVNMTHPFLEQVSGSEGTLNYLRQCTYDAIAEWRARHKAANLDPDTIKWLKDGLMRLPSQIDMRSPVMSETDETEEGETPAIIGVGES
jgi:hypothetical protein